MVKKQPKREKPDADDLEDDSDESPMTPERARRELGWDMLRNSDVQEVQDE